MADSKISDLTAGTVTASDDFVFVQSGTTKTDTIQGILDLVSSDNLGTADLTSTDNARIFALNGATSSNTFVIEDSAGQDIIKFQGDNDVLIYDAGNVNYAQFDQSTEKFRSANLEVGNIGTSVQEALKVYSRLASSSKVASFFNSSSIKIFDFRQSAGHATLALNNSSGTQKVYLNASTGQITAADKYIVNGSNGLGAASGTTYTFGGGGSGDIASMTFEGGILTAVTTVP